MSHDDRPTIHITNWSSRKLHGPGRKLTIMANPRRWEHGDGKVGALTPKSEDLALVRSKTITMAEYRRRCLEYWRLGKVYLAPDLLFWTGTNFYDDKQSGFVEDGDSLLCACSRAAAAKGECHRVWAAHMLVSAGWRVILDGREITPTQEHTMCRETAFHAATRIEADLDTSAVFENGSETFHAELVFRDGDRCHISGKDPIRVFSRVVANCEHRAAQGRAR